MSADRGSEGVGAGRRWTGRELYHRWCGSSETDEARYFDYMNPAHKRAWERLAGEVVEASVANRLAEKLEDARERLVAAWHDDRLPADEGIPLHDFLGMTWGEYVAWVEDPSALAVYEGEKTDG